MAGVPPLCKPLAPTAKISVHNMWAPYGDLFPHNITYLVPQVVRTPCPGGTLSLRFVTVPPYGTGIIFRDENNGGSLG